MDIYEVMFTRRSVREYAARPIPEDVLERLKESLRAAPSACNIQPYRFIFVTSGRIKEKIVEASKGRKWMADAAVIVVGCGFPEKAYQLMGGYGNSVDIDAAIALDHLSLAARREGLGTCWIGAFVEKEVKSLLGVPDAVKIVSMMTVGYPANEGVFKTDFYRRKKAEEIISFEKF